MPERRTTVVVDFQVGDIDIGDDAIEIPVEADVEDGEGAAQTADEWRSYFEEVFGSQATAMISGFFQMILAGVQRTAGALGFWASAILGAVVARLAVMYVRMKMAMAIFKQLGKAGVWALNMLWQGAQKATSGLVQLVEQGLMLSVDAMKAFTDVTLRAAEALGDRLQNFLERATETFADFQQSVANTVTVMGRFGEEGMAMRDKVGQAMKDLTKDSRIMATQAADAAYEIASAGFSELRQVVDMTRGSIQLAEATLTDVTETANTLVATMNQFNLAAGESTRVANAFAAAISKSPATMDKLSSSLETAGPIANSFGIGLERTVGALMALYKQGRTGSRAGTEFRIMLASIAKETDKARDVLQGLGIDISEISPGLAGVGGIVRAFEELQARIGRMQAIQAIYKALPVRAASALVALIGVGSKAMYQMSGAITGTTTAAKMQHDQIISLSGYWDKLVSLWENVYYDVLEGGLSPALVWVLKLLRSLVAQAREAGIFEEVGKLLYSLIQPIYALIHAIGPELIPAIEQLLEQLPSAIKQIADTVKNLIPTIISFIQQLPQMIGKAISTLLPVLLKFVSTVVPLLLDFASTVIPLLTKMFTQFGKAIIVFLERNGEELIRWFGFLLKTGLKLAAFLPSLQPLFERVVDAFMRWGPWIARVALNLIPQLLNMLHQLLPPFTRLANAVLPIVVYGMQQIAKIIQSEGVSAFQQLVGLIIKMTETAAVAIPLFASIIQKGLKVVGIFLNESAENWHGFGNIFLRLLNKLDQNFYYVVARIIDLLKDFMRNLTAFLRLAAVISRIARYVFLPLILAVETLLGLFSALQLVALALQGVLYGLAEVVVRIWDAIGTAPDWLKDVRDWLRGATGQGWEDVRDTWQAMSDISNAPSAAADAFDTASQAANNFRDTLGDTHTEVKDLWDEQQRQQQMGFGAGGGAAGAGGAGGGAAGAGGGAGGTGRAGGRAAWPEGTGPNITPTSYNNGAGGGYRYSMGPFYFNDLDQMKRAAAQMFGKMEKDKQDNSRLRGGQPTAVPTGVRG